MSATLMARGNMTSKATGSPMFFEPVSTVLPGGLIVMPTTLVTSDNHIFPVQVINLSEVDVWLSLGIVLVCFLQ